MEDDEGLSGTERFEAPWIFRGRDLNRVLALSDGVFAFAMTLLVLALALPVGLQGEGVRAYLVKPAFIGALYAYLIAFFVISLWWTGHHLIFSYIVRYDRALIRRNGAFLVFIAIMPFATTVLNSAGSDWIGPVVFSLIQVGAGASLGTLWKYASGPAQLTFRGLPADWRRYVGLSTLTTPIMFAVSIPVAFVNSTAAEILWLGGLVVAYLVRRRFRADAS